MKQNKSVLVSDFGLFDRQAIFYVSLLYELHFALHDNWLFQKKLNNNLTKNRASRLFNMERFVEKGEEVLPAVCK